MPVKALELEAAGAFDDAAYAAFESEREAGDQDSGRFLTPPSFIAAAATRASAAAAMLDVFLVLPAGAASVLEVLEGCIGALECVDICIRLCKYKQHGSSPESSAIIVHRRESARWPRCVPFARARTQPLDETPPDQVATVDAGFK